MDWFRNTDWNEEIEARFFEKLRQARDKGQCLRIQGCTLARVHPTVALRLLQEYFKLGESNFALAQAYVDQAAAYEALGEIDLAIQSYESALERENEFPTSITRAYLELPELILKEDRREHYHQALSVLEKYSNHPKFPIDRFQWHSMFAIISKELGNTSSACIHAKQALEEASRTHSGFQNHSKLGLVGDDQRLTRQKLEAILQES
ncbi:MAG: hypothetical protein KA746_09070 [Pyrinomonadaceae bacterium]|nr:hypothetical protein [Pyrinomonadaceae bacterium]MBP6212992.1 hypothetical protein [Pyrinomonadaceae bacterium]